MTRVVRTVGGLAALVALSWGIDRLFSFERIHFSSAVAAMLAVLAICFARGRAGASLERGAHVLLRWFPLFFVPACVGVMRYASVLAHQWLGLAAAMVLSSVAGIAVAMLVGTAVARRTERAAV